MNCPYCGVEMVKGLLSDFEDITWKSAKKEGGFWKSLLSIRDIEIPADEGWSMPVLDIPAHHCPHCRKFIFDGRIDKD